MCGGTVLRCLTDKKEEIKSEACQKEVLYFEKMEVSNYNNDVILAAACKSDVEKLCANVEPGKAARSAWGTGMGRTLAEPKAAARSQPLCCQTSDTPALATCPCKAVPFVPSPGEGRVHNCLREHRSQLSEACRREELLLEELEAENVELRPSLLRTCRAERRNFCGSVAPGQARVFRCLAEKLSDPDFGEACRNEIIGKLHRRQANWKLDPTLRKACR